MTRRARIQTVCILALALLLGGSAVLASNDNLEKDISLNLVEADLRMLFDLFKEILDVELEIDPAVNGTISFAFDEITVRTSLNAICESANCVWELVDGDPAVLRISPGTKAPSPDIVNDNRPEEAGYRLDSPVSLKLVDADATAVLEVAAKIINARLLLDRDLKGKSITVNADGVPLSTFLDSTCEELDCEWELIDGDPPTLGIYYR